MSKEAAMAIATGVAPVAPVIPPAEGTTAAPPADDLVSSRIAQIARKEAKYQEEMVAYKKDLASFQEKKGKFDPFYERYTQFEEMKAKDPVAAIKMLGFSDTDFVNFVASQEDTSTPEERASKAALAEIDKFKKTQAEEEAQRNDMRNKEAISQLQKGIGEAIKADADKYEFCNFYGEGAEALIFQTIQEGFREDIKTNPNAEPMSAAEAAELVEKYYEDQATSLTKLKKLNKTDVPVVEAPKEEPLRATVVTPPKAPIPPPVVRTLTNRQTPPAAASIRKQESAGEKRERLMRALSAGVKP